MKGESVAFPIAECGSMKRTKSESQIIACHLIAAEVLFLITALIGIAFFTSCAEKKETTATSTTAAATTKASPSPSPARKKKAATKKKAADTEASPSPSESASPAPTP
jgi:cytoskeletal protein RodZ